MTTSSEQRRAWSGPAVLSYGFRPFFLGAAVWAAISMLLWISQLTGALSLPTAFDPVSWHAHEFLFGYLGAVIAGFLLTAVPNWTGRLPMIGWPLFWLFASWAVARAGVMVSDHLNPVLVAGIDLVFPLALSAVILREILAGKNWKNLIVLGLLATFTAGNAVFHWEAARGDLAASGFGLRIGLGATILMVAVIGGRIVPSFTRNWMVKRGMDRLPTPPMQRFDKIALVGLLIAVLMWIAAPDTRGAGLLLVLAALLHLARLTRWEGVQTLQDPLLAVLHLAYLFVPLGALAIGLNGLVPDLFSGAAAQHIWMGGGLGLMTLAVMTRATLGHTGQPMHANPATVAIYASLVMAVLARVAAGLFEGLLPVLHNLSAVFWIAAFGGFALVYGRLILRPRKTGDT